MRICYIRIEAIVDSAVPAGRIVSLERYGTGAGAAALATCVSCCLPRCMAPLKSYMHIFGSRAAEPICNIWLVTLYRLVPAYFQVTQ